MGKLAVVVHDNEEFTLSLVSWSFLRRLAQGKDARNLMGVQFTPRSELAVWRGAPATSNVMRVPNLLVYFASKRLAAAGLDEIGIAVRTGGFGQPLLDLLQEMSAYRRSMCIAPFCDVAAMISGQD